MKHYLTSTEANRSVYKTFRISTNTAIYIYMHNFSLLYFTEIDAFKQKNGYIYRILEC